MFKPTICSLLLAISVPALAQKTSVKKDSVKKEVEASAFTGSFLFELGRDTNVGDSKDNTTGSFYQLKPSIGYKNGIFGADFSVGIKDFSDQAISDNAKETTGDISMSINTKLFGNTESATTLGLSYGDTRIPDYFAGEGSVTSEEGGANHRKVSQSISQTLKWDYSRLNLQADLSYTNKDYSSKYSDFVDGVWNAKEFELDHDKWEGSARVGIKLRENIEVAATPLVSLQKYDDREARLSNGTRPGNGRMTEFLVNEMKAELIVNAGALSLTPSVTSGLNIDQANGGEDFRYTAAALDASVMLSEKKNFKITGSIGMKNEAYDNYTAGVVPTPEKREDDIQTAAIGASFDIAKNLNMAINYSNNEETSNKPGRDYNYNQEVVTTGLTVSF